MAGRAALSQGREEQQVLRMRYAWQHILNSIEQAFPVEQSVLQNVSNIYTCLERSGGQVLQCLRHGAPAVTHTVLLCNLHITSCRPSTC